MISQPEYWQRGPVENIPDLLQPVAHALLQARAEVSELMTHFPKRLLWNKPAGLASPAFHLQHMAGVLDRLFTYAKAKPLNAEQMQFLAAEGKNDEHITVKILLDQLHKQVDQALLQLSNTDQQTLTDFRAVGKKQLPSTVMGLLFHAAEHTMRHVGQLLVTVKMVIELDQNNAATD